MTMKTKKTLQHIAAVAVVLLTLCLVFAAPVAGAKGTFPAVTDGSTITLQTDYELSQTLVIPEGVTVTIDLNGHYVKFNDTVPGVGIENHGTLTINDTVGTGNVYTTNTTTQARDAVRNYGTLTINAGYFGDSDEDMTNQNSLQRGPALRNFGTATINGGNFTSVTNDVISGGYAYAIITGLNAPDAVLTINYATVYGQMNGVISVEGGKAVINDGYFNLGGTSKLSKNCYCLIYCGGYMGEAYADVDVEINGGEWVQSTVLWNLDDFSCKPNSETRSIKITDGVFKTVRTGVTAKDFFVSNGNTALETTIEDDYTIYTVVDAEAKVDNVGYLTLADAITAANAGDTVTLLKDVSVSEGVELDQDITFNLGEYTITHTGDDDLFTVNAGNLTINADGDGGIISHGTRIINLNTDDPASLTVKGGTYSQNGDSSNAVFVIALDNDQEKTSTITGATISSNYTCFEVAGYADVTLENCIISTTKEVPSTSGYLHAIIASYGGTVHVKGGSVTSDGIALASFFTNGEITVEDAVITGTAAALQAMPADPATHDYQTGKSAITVSSGTVNGNITTEAVSIDGEELAYNAGSGVANIVITGGTFTVNPSAYIPSGYEVVQPGDKYLVQKYVDRSSSSSSSVKPEEPEQPEQPEEPVVEPETPAAPGEVTVETEVTDGGEVELETPAAEGEGGSAAADEDETKITGVVLPTGTDSEVTFVPEIGRAHV